MTPQDWEALAARCEAGESRQLDAALYIAFTPGAMLAGDRIANAVEADVQCWVDDGSNRGCFLMPPHFTTSIDAAASLMPSGWWVEVTIYPSNTRAMAVTMPGNGTKTAVGSATTEALARDALACRVRALLAGKEGAA